MIWAALHAMPTLPGVLLIAGIVAAALSSATTFLSLISFSASQDLIATEERSDRQRLRASRVVMLGVSVAILLVTWYQPPAIMWITYFAATLFASSWGPVAFMSIWSGRITADAAFWGIVVGFAGNFIATLLDVFEVVALPVFLDPFVIGIVASVAVIELVSRAGKVTAAEERYRLAIHETPPEEIDVAMAGTTSWFANGLVICGAGIALLLVVCYARPYQKAVAHVEGARDALANIALDGEMVFALGYGVILMIAGAIAWWWTRRAYFPPSANALANAAASGADDRAN